MTNNERKERNQTAYKRAITDIIDRIVRRLKIKRTHLVVLVVGVISDMDSVGNFRGNLRIIVCYSCGSKGNRLYRR